MKQERKQILEMLAQGKIQPEDAERLLDKLGAGEAGDAVPAASPSRLKYLRVFVDSSDGDKVNIRVPLALIKTGIKLGAVLPAHVSDKLDESGVDLHKLTELDGEELNDALRELEVNVDSNDGDVVRIFCE
jgi:hypothetical protein